MTDRLVKWWKQLWCEHHWRPALQTRMPSKIDGYGRQDYGLRVCDYCKKIDPLTDAEFYAQFGRMPIL